MKTFKWDSINFNLKIILYCRCVDEEDKSLSIGVTETLLSLLAFIPAPIFYGVIMGKPSWIWYKEQNGQ